MNVIASRDSNSKDFNAFKLALAVLAERVSSLPDSDKDDLFELTKILFSATDEEERLAAMQAMDEIMEQQKISVVSVPEKEGQLDSWLQYISQKIRELRLERKWNQAELAERAGLTQSHVSRLENQEHSPSNATLRKLANAFGLDIAKLDPSSE